MMRLCLLPLVVGLLLASCGGSPPPPPHTQPQPETGTQPTLPPTKDPFPEPSASDVPATTRTTLVIQDRVPQEAGAAESLRIISQGWSKEGYYVTSKIAETKVNPDRSFSLDLPDGLTAEIPTIPLNSWIRWNQPYCSSQVSASSRANIVAVGALSVYEQRRQLGDMVWGDTDQTQPSTSMSRINVWFYSDRAVTITGDLMCLANDKVLKSRFELNLVAGWNKTHRTREDISPTEIRNNWYMGHSETSPWLFLPHQNGT